MEKISYAKYLASPQYKKYPHKGLVGWLIGKFPPSVEDLQKKYDFAYYSSMNAAVNAVNNGTSNADATKETAVAGVYTDKSGGKNVVLLKDSTESTRLSPSVDMTINLGGHTLSTVDQVCIDSHSGCVTIDGRLPGSTVSVSTSDGRLARIIQVRSGDFVVCGGTYIGNSNGVGADGNGGNSVILNGDNITLTNATIVATETNGQVMGISDIEGATTTISNCKITTISAEGPSYGVATVGETTISNCDIRSYSNYNTAEKRPIRSCGVVTYGIITVNNCRVFGTHSGLIGYGTLYVNGGTYEGYGHGGFYFAGTGTTSYVRNATIRDCDMPDGYTDMVGGRNGAGFYIGGGTGMDNISVYMDNCNVYGINKDQAIVLRGSSGEQNNSLYISNSTIPEGYKIRIDNDTHKLYIGKGCNFTADDTNRPSAVVVTDEVYVREVVA